MSQNEKKEKLTIFQKIDKFGDLFFLNLLFIISCVPIITIGAAVTALYAYTIKLAKDEETTLWKGYWKAFKDNFKPATKAWIVVLVFAAILYVLYVASFGITGIGYSVILVIMAFIAIYLSFTLPLLFPMIARYENTTANMFKNAFLIAISNLGSWLYLFFIWAIPIALYATNKTILYYTWVLWLVILVAVLAYAGSFVINKLFAKIEEAMETKEKEQQEERKTNKNKKTNEKKSIAVNYNNPADDDTDETDAIDKTDAIDATETTDESDVDE